MTYQTNTNLDQVPASAEVSRVHRERSGRCRLWSGQPVESHLEKGPFCDAEIKHGDVSKTRWIA